MVATKAVMEEDAGMHAHQTYDTKNMLS